KAFAFWGSTILLSSALVACFVYWIILVSVFMLTGTTAHVPSQTGNLTATVRTEFLFRLNFCCVVRFLIASCAHFKAVFVCAYNTTNFTGAIELFPRGFVARVAKSFIASMTQAFNETTVTRYKRAAITTGAIMSLRCTQWLRVGPTLLFS